MCQSFVSTYRDHFRWSTIEGTPSAKPKDKFANFFPGEDIWLRGGVDVTEDEAKKSAEEQIRAMYKRRFYSTYQVDYCKDQVIQAPGVAADSFENELLEYCNNLYLPGKRPKIAPPLSTARQIYGYIRPSRLYTPLTNYQYCIGKTAYEILKGGGAPAHAAAEKAKGAPARAAGGERGPCCERCRCA